MKIVTTSLELPFINDGLFMHAYPRNIHPFLTNRSYTRIGKKSLTNLIIFIKTTLKIKIEEL